MRDEPGATIIECRRMIAIQNSIAIKLYRYTILNRDHPSALNYRRSWFIPHALDVAGMLRGAKYFLGRHDFTSFRAGNCNAKTPIRTLDRVEIFKENGHSL